MKSKLILITLLVAIVFVAGCNLSSKNYFGIGTDVPVSSFRIHDSKGASIIMFDNYIFIEDSDSFRCNSIDSSIIFTIKELDSLFLDEMLLIREWKECT